jgi:hypothetical protein
MVLVCSSGTELGASSWTLEMFPPSPPSVAAAPTASPVRTPFSTTHLGLIVVAHTGICVDDRGDDLVADKLPPCRRALCRAACASCGDHASCARSTRWTRSARAPAGMGNPKAAALGQPAGFRPSRPLWPWTAARPEGIVGFFYFSFGFTQIGFKSKFGFNLKICPNLFKLEN